MKYLSNDILFAPIRITDCEFEILRVTYANSGRTRETGRSAEKRRRRTEKTKRKEDRKHGIVGKIVTLAFQRYSAQSNPINDQGISNFHLIGSRK